MISTTKLKMVIIASGIMLAACTVNLQPSAPALLPTLIPTDSPEPVASPTVIPTSLPTLTLGGGVKPVDSPTVMPSPEIIENYTFPKVADAILDNSGNYKLLAGSVSRVSWVDAPVAASLYEFNLKLHSDGSVLVIGTDTDDLDGIFIDWVIPENLDGGLQVSAYYPDGREIHSSVINVYSGVPMEAGTCVVRSDTIVAISVYREPSDTAEIIGAMYPNAVVEVVGKSSNGWYQIKTDNIDSNQKDVLKTAWLYPSFVVLSGTCENMPTVK